MSQVAIALSVILSFAGWEFLGLASGGMISAGYLALFVSSPFRIVSTIFLSLVVYVLMILLNKILLIYGKRRFMLCVILGFLFTFIWSKLVPEIFFYQDLRSIGFIIPGLIANDMMKQGIFKTIGMLAVITLLVKLLLMLCTGMTF